MPSAYIRRRQRPGGTRFVVEFRLGGRESKVRNGGTFETRREALARRAWVLGELAAMRVPDLRSVEPEPEATLREVAQGWRESRIGVSAGTRTRHGVELERILRELGDRAPAS